VAAARRAAPPPVPVSMPALLREALRSPRDLLLMLAALVVAMLVTSPLEPIYLWGPAALLLAAIPGTRIMNRVRERAEQRIRREGTAGDK
jgi:NADH:ubiquinone oxidoreductase subunit 4 (subunit M)